MEERSSSSLLSIDEFSHHQMTRSAVPEHAECINGHSMREISGVSEPSNDITIERQEEDKGCDDDDEDSGEKSRGSGENFSLPRPSCCSRRKRNWFEMMRADPDIHEFATDGSWIECKLCFTRDGNSNASNSGVRKRIQSRSGRPFSKERWMEHKRSAKHRNAVHRMLSQAVVEKPCVGMYHKKQDLLRLFCLYGHFKDLDLVMHFDGDVWSLCASDCKRMCTVKYGKAKCCEKCLGRKKDMRIYKRLSRMGVLDRVTKSLGHVALSESDFECLQKFTATTTPGMNPRKREVVEAAKRHLGLVKWLRKNCGKNISDNIFYKDRGCPNGSHEVHQAEQGSDYSSEHEADV